MTQSHTHDDSHSHVHDTHPDIVKRLKRADGHLRSVIEMIEGGRPCLDVAHQLHAVEKAIAQAKKTLIHDHLDHCLDNAVGPLDADHRTAIDEFRAIAKYL
ncbi:metal-sensing transcriptional repressor [Devosia sp.]|uniref:metal-sensing transcriptional repressor n=1 Tax=Devosia sp. TaxID=1871048 RepID=UPI0027373DBB|nr:metal-sensing transcriptional repressor [Devosia sp.]MDP2778947.1 metal-sensing transcriptional repressor [Devosia sp.]